MFWKILKKDLVRNKILHLILFLFLFLASYLTVGAISILTGLSGSMEQLLEAADSAHFAQMHSGALDEDEIESFAREQEKTVAAWQVVSLLNVDGSAIYMGQNQSPEADSVLENAFVVQNERFDYLLDLNNEILAVAPGEIAVPVYHMQQYGLQIGDPIRMQQGSYEKTFTITAFLRDSLMNSSMITSKRLLINETDWQEMQQYVGEIEYMIELQAVDAAAAGSLEHLYNEAGLPAKGTGITWLLVRLINAMSDGLTASLLILAAVLIMLMAMLCLKFTITASMEEEYREIGAMKALGIPGNKIQGLYLAKYTAISVLAGGSGWLAGVLTKDLFLGNITLYMGQAASAAGQLVISGCGVLLVILVIIGFCRLVLRKFSRISAAEAVRYGQAGKTQRRQSKRAGCASIGKTILPDINIAYGLREVSQNLKSYGTLGLIYILSVFLMLIPINLLSTLKAPEFISYMGTGVCDIRIDIQDGEMAQTVQKLGSYLENDKDVELFSAMTTSAYRVQNADGGWEKIKIESGDFSVFPQAYSSGAAPSEYGEIALSALQAEDLNAAVGDILEIDDGTASAPFIVSGIYQDVTNGGKTAKAVINEDAEVLWMIVYVEIGEGVSMSGKISEYRGAFDGMKVTEMETYLGQTLGSVLELLEQGVWLAAGLALAVTVFITILFFRMQMAKETKQIIIMQSLGFTRGDICRQYITRGIVVLLTGIVLGSAGVYLLGGQLAGLVITGVNRMTFITNPWISYLGCPAVLALTVMLTIWAVSRSMKRSSDLKAIAD